MTMDHQYLVRYGRPGFVGRFASVSVFARGDRVVLRGPRGTEWGEVLLAPWQSADPCDGQIIRIVTDADADAMGRFQSHGMEVLSRAEMRAAELATPLVFVDAEVTFDGSVILHAVPWGECDATGLLAELAEWSGTPVRLLDLSRTPTAKDSAEPGCGKPGCGSEGGGCGCSTGGGCSTGSCSRGAVRSSGELTEYFAELRNKMESAGLARTPLN